MKKIKMKIDSTFNLKNTSVNLSIDSSIIISNWNLVSRSVNILVVDLIDDSIRASDWVSIRNLTFDSLYDLFKKSEQERLK